MPRLNKGQIAPGVKARLLASERSALCRIKAFESVKDRGADPDNILLNFCNVASLASWSDEQRGISPLSAKTLRKHINNLYSGGLSKLCSDAIAISEYSARNRRKNKVNNFHDAQLKAEHAIDSALAMTARYLDLLERLKRLSLDDERVEFELSKHLRRYENNPHVRVVK